MSELADELARRMEPEHLKAIAAEKVSDLKEQARERAVEKADEIKTQARETVMRKSHEVKERADTPMGWSMLGAIIGAGVGSMLMKKAFDVRQHSSGNSRMYGDYDRDLPSLVPSPDEGLMRPTGDKLGSPGSDNLKERASGLVDRAMDKTHGLREHIPDSGQLRHQASDLYGTVSENPVLLAIGGLAIGALFASFIPVSNRERQFLEPARAKVKERISTLGEQLESKLSGQNADEESQDEEFQASAASESERERGTIPPLPPLDDFTSVH
ncbi:hypothetical protein [Archangium violaceum]|uniref:hypothetical protein n=1 Tax=Archangium violaceum TaxID=83451 RepID=UPI0036DCD976